MSEPALLPFAGKAGPPLEDVAALLAVATRFAPPLSLSFAAAGLRISLEVSPDVDAAPAAPGEQTGRQPRQDPTPPNEDRLSEACAADVLKLLADVGRRLTLLEIQDEFSVRKIEWSATTVNHTCPAMRRDGRLTNRKKPDDRGRGYGLPAWGPGDVDPTP